MWNICSVNHLSSVLRVFLLSIFLLVDCCHQDENRISDVKGCADQANMPLSFFQTSTGCWATLGLLSLHPVTYFGLVLVPRGTPRRLAGSPSVLLMCWACMQCTWPTCCCLVCLLTPYGRAWPGWFKHGAWILLQWTLPHLMSFVTMYLLGYSPAADMFPTRPLGSNRESVRFA